MMKPKQKLSVKEYLDIENASNTRHELVDGDMFAMAGGTRNHNRIIKRVSAMLSQEGCETFTENIKVLTNFESDVCYPDILLVCGKPEGTDKFVNNPLVIVEVLSSSTRDYDMGSKFRKYQRVRSLKHYILIEQYGVYVEHSERKEGEGWLTHSPYCNLKDTFIVEGMEVKLKDIYSVVDWDDK